MRHCRYFLAVIKHQRARGRKQRVPCGHYQCVVMFSLLRFIGESFLTNSLILNLLFF